MEPNYLYAVLKENHADLKKESALKENNYKPTKYALIEKKCFDDDGTEKINRIIYSNNLLKLTAIAKTYISWYNYPMELKKDMQQNISEL